MSSSPIRSSTAPVRKQNNMAKNRPRRARPVRPIHPYGVRLSDMERATYMFLFDQGLDVDAFLRDTYIPPKREDSMNLSELNAELDEMGIAPSTLTQDTEDVSFEASFEADESQYTEEESASWLAPTFPLLASPVFPPNDMKSMNDGSSIDSVLAHQSSFTDEFSTALGSTPLSSTPSARGLATLPVPPSQDTASSSHQNPSVPVFNAFSPPSTDISSSAANSFLPAHNVQNNFNALASGSAWGPPQGVPSVSGSVFSGPYYREHETAGQSAPARETARVRVEKRAMQRYDPLATDVQTRSGSSATSTAASTCSLAGTLDKLQIEKVIKKAVHVAYQQTPIIECKWQNCGQPVDSQSLAAHLYNVHGLKQKPAWSCQWQDGRPCPKRVDGKEIKEIVKHIRARLHLDMRVICVGCETEFCRTDVLGKHLRT